MACRMRWAMVSSVADESLMPKLREFGVWFVNVLEKESDVKGMSCAFEPEPEVVLHAQPNSQDQFEKAYREIVKEHPKVLLVMQILPEKDSKEYQWMRSVTERYGLIRQGIILENALTKFEHSDLSTVIENVLKWISRRLHEIVEAIQNDKAPFRLCVGEMESGQRRSGHLSMNGIENVMERILNERVKMEQRVPIAAVKVKGFPSAMNKYQLGAIFANLIIKSIDLCEEGKDKCCDGDEHLTPSTNNNTNAQYALIEFANKFHAAQAAIHYNGYRVDSKHELLVVPVHAEVLMNI